MTVHLEDFVVDADMVDLTEGCVPPVPCFTVDGLIRKVVHTLGRPPVAEEEKLGGAILVLAGPRGAAVEAIFHRVLLQACGHLVEEIARLLEFGCKYAERVVRFGAQHENDHLLVGTVFMEIAILVGDLRRDAMTDGIVHVVVALESKGNGQSITEAGHQDQQDWEESIEARNDKDNGRLEEGAHQQPCGDAEVLAQDI